MMTIAQNNNSINQYFGVGQLVNINMNDYNISDNMKQFTKRSLKNQPNIA